MTHPSYCDDSSYKSDYEYESDNDHEYESDYDCGCYYKPVCDISVPFKKTTINSTDKFIINTAITGSPIPFKNQYVSKDRAINKTTSNATGFIFVSPPKPINNQDISKNSEQLINIYFKSDCKVDYNDPIYFYDPYDNYFIIDLLDKTLTFKRNNSVNITIINIDYSSNIIDCEIFFLIKGKKSYLPNSCITTICSTDGAIESSVKVLALEKSLYPNFQNDYLALGGGIQPITFSNGNNRFSIKIKAVGQLSSIFNEWLAFLVWSPSNPSQEQFNQILNNQNPNSPEFYTFSFDNARAI